MSDSRQRSAALTIAILGSFLTPFMGASLNIAIKEIGEELSMNPSSLSWMATSYLLSAAVFLIPFGKVSDIVGRKKIYLIGMIIYTVSAAFGAVAWSGASLIYSRMLQGVGGAMIFSTGVAILTSVFPKEKRGLVLGLTITSVYLGLMLGPYLGGILTHKFGWRSIFYFNIPLGVMVVTLILTFLKGEWSEAKGEKFDFIGSLFYGLSIAGIMYGLKLLPNISGIYYIVVGLALLIVFVLYESKIKFPVLDTSLFLKNRVFTFSNIAAFINYSATFAVSFMLSLYLRYVKELDPNEAGKILIAQPFMMVVFSPLAGYLSDKMGSRLLSSLGMTFTTIGLSMIIFFHEDTSISYIILSLITVGFGFALFSSPNTNAVMSSVEKRFYGVASATLGAMRLTGQMISMGVAMLVINIYVGKVDIVKENAAMFMKSMDTAFMIFTAMCFIGIFASLARGRTDNMKVM